MPIHLDLICALLDCFEWVEYIDPVPLAPVAGTSKLFSFQLDDGVPSPLATEAKSLETLTASHARIHIDLT